MPDNPNTLRFNTALDAVGLRPDFVAGAGLEAPVDTNAFGMLALHRGTIDAGRVWEGRDDVVDTPDIMRRAPEYEIGFQATTAVLNGRVEL